MDSLQFDIEGYTLVRASPEDRDYLIECIGESVIASVSGIEREMCGFWIDDTLAVVSNNLDAEGNEAFILLGSKGERAGMLWMGISRDQFTCDEIGYLLNVFVEKDFRGKGLGKALVRSAEKWCVENDLCSMSLNVGNENRSAMAMYEEMGYRTQSMVMRKPLR